MGTGGNNFDSVQRLKKADDVVQAAFDAGFQRPAPLAAPAVTATVLDGEVILEWTDSAPSNNYLEGNVEDTPIAPEGQDLHLFEGYTVYQFESAGDQVGTVIANYDVANGVTQVIEAIPGDLSMVTASGSDNGSQSYYSVQGLTNFSAYHFGVQTYAYNEYSTPKVYRGPTARVEVIPTRLPRVIADAATEEEADPGADFRGAPG